jgi:hypothetical protein
MTSTSTRVILKGCHGCRGCPRNARSMSADRNVEMALAYAPSLFDRFSVLGVSHSVCDADMVVWMRQARLIAYDLSNHRMRVMALWSQVLADAEMANLPRDLDVVELWSGVQSIVNAALKLEKKAVPFDIARIPGQTTFSEDICSWGLR